MVVETALDRIEILYLPAAGGVLKRKGPAGRYGLREAHRCTVDEPPGGLDVDVRGLLSEVGEKLAMPAGDRMVPLSCSLREAEVASESATRTTKKIGAWRLKRMPRTKLRSTGGWMVS